MLLQKFEPIYCQESHGDNEFAEAARQGNKG